MYCSPGIDFSIAIFRDICISFSQIDSCFEANREERESGTPQHNEEEVRFKLEVRKVSPVFQIYQFIINPF